MAEAKNASTSKTKATPDVVELPVEVATAEPADPNAVVGVQQDYEEGENPSNKGISGTYPKGDDILVRKADGQVWPADNADAFPAQDELDAKAADVASKEGHGVDSPDLIPPAAGTGTNASVEGTASDPASAPRVADLQAARDQANG